MAEQAIELCSKNQYYHNFQQRSWECHSRPVFCLEFEKDNQNYLKFIFWVIFKQFNSKIISQIQIKIYFDYMFNGYNEITTKVKIYDFLTR